jgi:ribonuclease T1
MYVCLMKVCFLPEKCCGMPAQKKYFWRSVLLGLCFLGIFLSCSGKDEPAKEGTSQSHTTEVPSLSGKKIPAYVTVVLSFVKLHQRAPEGYVGGRTFQNREKNLPLKTRDGQKIQYREWDVYPKKQGKNRGAERLITGSDQSAWYTKDHYKTFTRIE